MSNTIFSLRDKTIGSKAEVQYPIIDALGFIKQPTNLFPPRKLGVKRACYLNFFSLLVSILLCLFILCWKRIDVTKLMSKNRLLGLWYIKRCAYVWR